MTLSGKDRDFVAEIIGEETLKKLESSAEERGKALEKAGIAYKLNGDPEEEKDKASVPSLDQSVFLLSLKKISDDSKEAVTSATKAAELATEAAKTATNAVTQIDERMSTVEGDIGRIKQTLLSIMDPVAASKSPLTQVSSDDPQANLLDEKNKDPNKGGKKSLSLMEELAISVGDDPALYSKT